LPSLERANAVNKPLIPEPITIASFFFIYHYPISNILLGYHSIKMFKAFGLETSFNLAGNKKSKRDFISDKVLSGPGISKKEIDQAVALFDIISWNNETAAVL
jgi:hypothetical protein